MGKATQERNCAVVASHNKSCLDKNHRSRAHLQDGLDGGKAKHDARCECGVTAVECHTLHVYQSLVPPHSECSAPSAKRKCFPVVMIGGMSRPKMLEVGSFGTRREPVRGSTEIVTLVQCPQAPSRTRPGKKSAFGRSINN